MSTSHLEVLVRIAPEGSTSRKKPATAAKPIPTPVLDLVVLEETDVEGDTGIKDGIIHVDNQITLSRTAKVSTPLRFDGTLDKLPEFLAKMKIYINYYTDGFQTDEDEVMFVLSFIEGKAFKFIKVFLNNYNDKLVEK